MGGGCETREVQAVQHERYARHALFDLDRAVGA